MQTEKELLELLCRKAAVQPKVAGVRVAAAIADSKGILTLGFNRYKTHPLQAKFSGHDKKICLHAEMDAIVKYLRCYGIEDYCLDNCTLYVARVKEVKHDSYKTGLAKPCPACQKAAIHFNIGNVVWTEDTP